MMVNTVTGAVDAAGLGPTLMHEHVCCADWSLRMCFGEHFFDYERTVEAAAAMFLKARRECGIATVVDGTPANLGRDVGLIREVAERTGLQFVVSSGFYYHEEPGLMFYPEDELVGLLVSECEGGIAGTGIRPGIMKAAVDGPEMTDYMRKMVTVVARAAAATGLPVFCHHNVKALNGGQILDIFAGQGVPLAHVILGHSGDTDDLGYLTRMLERGCYLGMDRFGYCDYSLSLDRRVATIAALYAAGWGARLLLSHDLVVAGLFGGRELDIKPEERSVDFTFLEKTVQPVLAAAGVSEAQFAGMLTENPRAFFAGD